MGLPEGMRTIALTDGRTLAYREYGDPVGVPCIYTTGHAASSAAGAILDPAAKSMGVRWISVDKPGYGWSTFQPGRTLLDWPKDVVQLADHLGIGRFAVAGESGGGPHVLALAYALPDRLTTAVDISGMGPPDTVRSIKDMNRLNKILISVCVHAPWLLGLAMAGIARAVSDPVKAERFMRKRMKAAPETDREAFAHPMLRQAICEAFRDGHRAAAQEMRLLSLPWGFRLEDVRAHVDLFHGEQDTNCPVSIARAVAARLPDCNARFCPEYGHAVGFHMGKDVLQCVLEAA